VTKKQILNVFSVLSYGKVIRLHSFDMILPSC